MAKPDHISIVREGMDSIRKWNRDHPQEQLELSGADLHKIGLNRADLFNANLSMANLSGANLSNVDLTLTNLSRADLKRAGLAFSKLVATNLGGANLSGSFLTGTRFQYPNLVKTIFTNAKMFRTVFSDCDLSECIGLSSVEHGGPSTIGIDTLIKTFRNAGNHFSTEIEAFFLNAGVPKQIIDALPGTLMEIRYYTCFLAYGEPDKTFAERLNNDLKTKGVSRWFFHEDSVAGESLWKEINQERKKAEKMIVLCSANGLVRDGLLKEVEEQLDEDPDKIIPVSLDNIWKQPGFVIRRGQREDFKSLLLRKTYVDFSDESKYADSLSKLLAGIKRK
jgi:hypothetical protein